MYICFIYVHRYNSSFTKMIGAICGLGYDPETSRPLFKENDIDITFDTIIDSEFLVKVNYLVIFKYDFSFTVCFVLC